MNPALPPRSAAAVTIFASHPEGRQTGKNSLLWKSLFMAGGRPRRYRHQLKTCP